MKTIILDYEENENLKPVTCNTPKLLLNMCGRPNAEYLLDLISQNEGTDVVVYGTAFKKEIKDFLNSYENKNLSTRTVFLGRDYDLVKGMKIASKSFDEPFLVLFSDVLTDVDLKRFMHLHKESGNDISIAMTDNKTGSSRKSIVGEDGKVLLNTGVYAVNPECIDLFVSDSEGVRIVPKTGSKVGQFLMAGYLNRAHDIPSYLACQQDIIWKRVKTSLTVSDSYIASNDGKVPAGNYTIIPPVYIGKNVRVGKGSVLGPGSVILDGCIIGRNVHISGSMLANNSVVFNDCLLANTVVMDQCTIGQRCKLFDHSAVGFGSIISHDCEVLQNVKVWPEKYVESGFVLYGDIKVSVPKQHLIREGKITSGLYDSLSPEKCVELGKACASLMPNSRIGVSTDGSRKARMLAMAFQSGAMSSGAGIWYFGATFLAQSTFFARFCGMNFGVHFKSESNEFCTAFLFDNSGEFIDEKTKNKIEGTMRNKTYLRGEMSTVRDFMNISSVRLIYGQELSRMAHGQLDFDVSIDCPNLQIEQFFRESLERLGCGYSRSFCIHINYDGTEATIKELISEKEYKTYTIDEIRRVVVKHSKNKNFRLNDALFLVTKLLAIMRDEDKSLSALMYETDSEDGRYIMRKMFEEKRRDVAFSTEF